MKFFSELVKKNVMALDEFESLAFPTVNELEMMNEVPGLRTCIFLCKIL